MNPDQDALAGLINQSDRNAPPVSQALVDHLREKFATETLFRNGADRVENGDEAMALLGNITGVFYVLDYLASLLPPPPLAEENTNEPAQAESEGPDPRRPGARSRG